MSESSRLSPAKLRLCKLGNRANSGRNSLAIAHDLRPRVLSGNLVKKCSPAPVTNGEPMTLIVVKFLQLAMFSKSASLMFAWIISNCLIEEEPESARTTSEPSPFRSLVSRPVRCLSHGKLARPWQLIKFCLILNSPSEVRLYIDSNPLSVTSPAGSFRYLQPGQMIQAK